MPFEIEAIILDEPTIHSPAIARAHERPPKWYNNHDLVLAATLALVTMVCNSSNACSPG
jgi:hypothetical protein